MLRLVYLSRPAPGVTSSGVEDILRASRGRNDRAGITGCLAIRSDVFAQVLEGPPRAVTDLFARIHRDARHTDVVLLRVEPVAERRFVKWSMACTSLMGLETTADFEAVDFGDLSRVDPDRLLDLLTSLSDRAPRLESLPG